MEWTTVKIHGKHEVKLPAFLASWDVWEYWEQPRIEHMASKLSEGHVLFDVGVESGWMSVLFARMVGAKNMVLIESTPQYWPNIKQTWEQNGLGNPFSTFCGLFGNQNLNDPMINSEAWPMEADGELTEARSYRYLHEHGATAPQLRIDEFCQATQIIPTALTIDVEGAELEVLKGAERLLTYHQPLIWLSVHPDLMERDYNTSPFALDQFFAKCHYKMTLLNIDHEHHYFCEPNGE